MTSEKNSDPRLSMSMNRRHFLKSTAAASLAFSSVAGRGAEQAANQYRTALIGCGWWGNNILGEAMASGACRITALCDVDARFLDKTVARVSKETGDAPKPYRDFREMLDREKPEIVIVGTPDHWHPLMTIAAVKAGAHVYVEKPIGHTIREGRAMVQAARDTGRVVQVGTHRRVSPHNVSGREFLISGKAGKIGAIRAFVHYGGGPERPERNAEPPAGVDWDLWCGPAPLRPFNARIHPKGFRNFLDYANGTLGDWGVHWMDQILWVMGDLTGEQWPRKVFSTGGRPIKGAPVFTPQEQTTDAPDHQVAVFEFSSFTATWEHRQFAANNAEKGERVGCYFYGEKGTFHMGWKGGWTFYPVNSREPVQHADPKLNQPDDQNIKELWVDFLSCIKAGGRPVCDIEKIHRSTNLSLLGMLSLKLGRSVTWDGERELCVGDDAANKLLAREYRSPWKYPGA